MIEYCAALDARFLQTLYAVRDPSSVQALIWISELGRAWTIYGFAFCIALVLVLYRKYAYAAGLVISVATSGVGILLLKGLTQRARPPVEFQAYLEVWYSLPSAHAALSVALYGFLAFLAWHRIKNRALRSLVITLLSLLVVLISFSRLYLGVHWASDVAMGVVLGILCAWLGAWYAQFVHKS